MARIKEKSGLYILCKKALKGIFIVAFLLIIFGIYKENFIDKKISNKIAKSIPEKPKIQTSLSVYPKIIYPGDPLLITIIASSTPIQVLYDNRVISLIKYKENHIAFVGIDFNETVLTHIVSVKFKNGVILRKDIKLTPREKIEKPLGIPEKLGGNTQAASKELIAVLSAENAELAAIKSSKDTLWSGAFVSPLAAFHITDPYGYDRKTVGQTIIHKGTDFRAAIGTEVRAMNDGIVRSAKKYTVYGNTVIIDHGGGLLTLYMHLSKLDVANGDRVKARQVIGLSGDTGYAEAAHLHISFKMNGISIDPATFLGFFGIHE